MDAALQLIESKSSSRAHRSWTTEARVTAVATARRGDPLDMSDIFGWIVSLILVGTLVITFVAIVVLIIAIII